MARGGGLACGGGHNDVGVPLARQGWTSDGGGAAVGVKSLVLLALMAMEEAGDGGIEVNRLGWVAGCGADDQRSSEPWVASAGR